MAELPELAEGLPPLQRALAGSVLRPWCHFELPTSTYLAQGILIPSESAALAGTVIVAPARESWAAVCAACLACVMHMSCMQGTDCNRNAALRKEGDVQVCGPSRAAARA